MNQCLPCNMQMPEIFSADELLGNPARFAKFAPPIRLAVLGDPVAHSRSPAFQNAALRACGISTTYARIHVPADRFEKLIRSLPAAGFIGANITIPHKASALEAVDTADAYARLSGSVNTLVIDQGKLHGFNTDGPGLSRAVQDEFGVHWKDFRIAILGAGGGAGRAIAAQCAIDRCQRLILVNRTPEKCVSLAKELETFLPGGRLRIATFDTSDLAQELEHTDLIINATSLGMKPGDPRIIPASWVTSHQLVFDTVYSGRKSHLLEDAESAGARGANGLSMLLHQGALSFEHWFQRPAPLETMREALFSIL